VPKALPIPGIRLILCRRTVAALRPSWLDVALLVIALMPPPIANSSMALLAKRVVVAFVTIALAAIRSARLLPPRACLRVTLALPLARFAACLARLRALLLAIYSAPLTFPKAVILFPDGIRYVSL